MDLVSSREISVILPVFNGEKYLHKCIKSVLNQDFDNFELIIADDGSKDLSGEIVHSFNDERIKYLYNERNVGVAKNLNRLIKEVSSPLLHILCQDDMLEENCLSTTVKFFREHPDIGMSFCKAIWIDKDGNEMQRGKLGDMPDVINPSLTMQLFMYYGCIMGSGSVICIKKECFDEFGLFNESFKVAQDFEMWVRICRRKNLGVIHKNLVRLRIHKGQQSLFTTSLVPHISENRKIFSMIFTQLPKEIYLYARLYFNLRHNVLHAHYCLRCLTLCRFNDFFRIMRIMGMKDFISGILCWFLTFNNHLYCPRPRFVE